MLSTTLLLLLALLALSVPVAAVMGVLGLALNAFYSSMPLQRAMGDVVWNASSEYILIAIPLFVMMGEVLLRSGIAEAGLSCDCAVDFLVAWRSYACKQSAHVLCLLLRLDQVLQQRQP